MGRRKLNNSLGLNGVISLVCLLLKGFLGKLPLRVSQLFNESRKNSHDQKTPIMTLHIENFSKENPFTTIFDQTLTKGN